MLNGSCRHAANSALVSDACAAALRAFYSAPQRGRYGPIMNVFVALLAGGLWMSSASAAEVSVRQLRPGTYEFALTNPTALSENEARAHIAKAAVSICKGLTAVPGRWRYESKEAISGGSPSSTETFRFILEVSCVPGAQTQTGERRPTLQNDEESQRAQNEVRLKSQEYFQLIASKRVDEALTHLAIAGMGVDEARWKSNKLSFQAMTGAPLEISITKITVYDNPAGAPAPGLYIAADYSNVYRDVPIHCGYLMWFRPVGGEFRITREETGHVTSEQLRSIPSAQLPEVKRRLRCLAP
jgi:hypothetical protein